MTRVNLAVPMCEYAHVSREKFLNKKLFMVRKAVQECIYLTQEVHKIKVQKLIMKTYEHQLGLLCCHACLCPCIQSCRSLTSAL